MGEIAARQAEADAFGKVETHGIETILAPERHGKPRELAFLWGGAFVNYASLFTASLLTTYYGLGVWDGLAATAIGTIAAAAILGLLSNTGPRPRLRRGLRARPHDLFRAGRVVVSVRQRLLAIPAGVELDASGDFLARGRRHDPDDPARTLRASAADDRRPARLEPGCAGGDQRARASVGRDSVLRLHRRRRDLGQLPRRVHSWIGHARDGNQIAALADGAGLRDPRRRSRRVCGFGQRFPCRL